MDNRSILAIVFCVIFYLGYSQWLAKKYPKQPTAGTPAGEQHQGSERPNTSSANTASQAPAAASASATPGAAEPIRLSPADLKLESDLVGYQFSQESGSLTALQLLKYKAENTSASGPVELLDGPLSMQAIVGEKPAAPFAGLYFAERHDRTLKFWRDQGDFRLTQEFHIPEVGFGADLKVSFTNISNKPVELTGGLLLVESIKPKKSTQILGIIPGASRQRDQIMYRADGSTEWLDIEKFCGNDKDPAKLDGVPINFLGVDRHYFVSVVEPKAKNGNLRMDHGHSDADGCQIQIVNSDRQGVVKPGDTVTLEFATYSGPKDLPIMEAHNPELGTAMHLGIFSFIARPLLSVIEGFQQVTHNYGVAIILLTICLKLLFFPLMKASSTSMHRMKKLNPQMQLIRDKYKDDKAKQQQELMKFMGSHKINPMKGCLPVLPQIPVFFAFYQVLQNSIQLRHAPFAMWIHDLSAMDPYFVTPLLMGVAMFMQQKLTPTTGMDKTQEKILMFMPIMFTVMMLTLPAGLTLYMLTNTLIGIVQQKWLYRRLEKLEPNPV